MMFRDKAKKQGRPKRVSSDDMKEALDWTDKKSDLQEPQGLKAFTVN